MDDGPTSLILHLRLVPPVAAKEISGGRRAFKSLVPSVDQSLKKFCSRITPRWKAEAEGLFLDLRGMDRLYGPRAEGVADICHQAQLEFPVQSAGLASSQMASRLASLMGVQEGGPYLYIVPPEAASSFLAGFSVRVLNCGRSEISRLSSLGVHTLGDLRGIPQSLLGAVFGDAAQSMISETEHWPSELQTETNSEVENILVARVRFRKPLASVVGERALRRALAMRALSRKSGAGRWSMVVGWASGARTTVSHSGPATDSWQSWLLLMDTLWSKLPSSRQGVRELELCFLGLPGACFQQMDLFTCPADSGMLSQAIAQIRKKFDPSFSSASEILLQEWGAFWEFDPRKNTHGRPCC